MTPVGIVLVVVLVAAAIGLLFGLAMLIGRWLAWASRGLEVPDGDGESM